MSEVVGEKTRKMQRRIKEHLLWKDFMQRGKKAYKKKQYIMAMEFFKAAYDLAKHFGSLDQRLGTTLNNLGLACFANKLWDHAESYFWQCFAVRDTCLMSDDLLIPPLFKQMAQLYVVKKQYKKAEPFCLRAISILENNYPRMDVAYLPYYEMIAIVYFHQHRYEEAERFLMQALAIRKQRFGKHHPSIKKGTQQLILINKRHEKYATALRLARQSIQQDDSGLFDVTKRHQPVFNRLVSVFGTGTGTTEQRQGVG